MDIIWSCSRVCLQTVRMHIINLQTELNKALNSDFFEVSCHKVTNSSSLHIVNTSEASAAAAAAAANNVTYNMKSFSLMSRSAHDASTCNWCKRFTVTGVLFHSMLHSTHTSISCFSNHWFRCTQTSGHVHNSPMTTVNINFQQWHCFSPMTWPIGSNDWPMSLVHLTLSVASQV